MNHEIKRRCERLIVTMITLFVLMVLSTKICDSIERVPLDNKVGALVSMPEVEGKGDGVILKKNVEFTTYNGRERDEQGNPYAKIQFRLDASGANDKVLNYTENTKSTDVVLMLDTSSSMKGNKFDKEKAAAMTFVTKLMEQGSNIRLSVIRFDTKVEVLGTFKDSKQDILDAITSLSNKDLGSLTDIQGAIIAGQRQLKASNAANKVMVILTDGEPNVFYSGQESDEMESTDGYIGTSLQAEYAKNLIPDAIWYTIGYDLENTKANNLLEEIASTNEYGEKYFYSASVKDNKGQDDLQGVFDKIAALLAQDIESNKLVDILPESMVLMEDSFESNDANVTIQRDDGDKKITYSWGTNDIVDKLYRFSFVVKIDLSKLSENQRSAKEPVNTNGVTVDVTANSLGSAYFSYAGDNSINLKSPIVYIPQIEKEDDKPTPTPVPTPTPRPEDLITIQKYAQWTTYQGKEKDEKGNPYTLITFDVDMREVNLEEDSYMTVTDYIPKEYSIIQDTINKGAGVTHTFEDDLHTIKFIWTSDVIDNRKYRVSFVTVLDLSQTVDDSEEQKQMTIFTNGGTVKGDGNENASAIFQYGDNFIAQIISPKLKLDLRKRYKVILHANGGNFKNGKYIYEYIEGEGLMLPGPNDVTRNDGFAIVGWKDNPMLLGSPIFSIGPEQTGDFELWAVWAKGPGYIEPTIEISKTAEWTGAYNEEGNPYARIIFDIDMTDKGLFYFKSGYTGDTMDVVLAIDLAESMNNEDKFNKTIDEAKSFAKLLLKVCALDVRIGVVGFSSDSVQTIDLVNNKNIDEFLKQLDELKTSGKTDVAKGIKEATKYLEKYEKDGVDHKTVVVLTDGYDGTEIVSDGTPYANIVSESEKLLSRISNSKIMSIPYDADDNTVKVLGNIASYNDRGLWMYLNTTENKEKQQLNRSGSMSSTSTNSVGASLFNNGYDYYGVEEAFEEIVHMVIEKIGSGINLVDYIPKELTILKSLVTANSGVYYEFNDDDSFVEFNISSDNLAAVKYTIIMYALVDIDKIPKECVTNGVATIYTNGETVSEKMEDAAVFRYGADYLATLKSPSLECVVNGSYSVTLHPNGGILAADADVKEYIGGIGIGLPGAESIQRQCYTFAGWYDNMDCTGTRYYEISGSERGNKEYWAKWIKNQYKVHLNANGGTIAPNKNVTSYFYRGGILNENNCKYY